nr:hypothetical protein [Rhodococcus wratislaviensis]
MRTIVKKPLTQITSKSMILAGVLPLCVPAKYVGEKFLSFEVHAGSIAQMVLGGGLRVGAA